MPEEPKERGIWAERKVQDFLSLPFVSEFVFRSLQTLDGTQKEVADFLIAYPGVGILMSQKTQKDPSARFRQDFILGSEGSEKGGFPALRRVAYGARKAGLVRPSAQGTGRSSLWVA